MKVEAQELEEYLRASLNAIRTGVETSRFLLDGPVEFNLAVTNTKEGDVGVKIYVASAEGKVRSEEVSHIRLLVRRNYDEDVDQQ
jgi:hypothetical protein